MLKEEKDNVHQLIFQVLNGDSRVWEADKLPYARENIPAVTLKTPVAHKLMDVLEQMDAELAYQREFSNKLLQLYKLMIAWMDLKQQGKGISAYFLKHSYESVGIYGLHYVGELLCSELLHEGIEIKYTIDKAKRRYGGIKGYNSPTGLLEPIDVMIVTPITFYDEIANSLSDCVDCPIISIKTIIDELLGIR